MSKLLGCTSALVLIAVGISIASLVLNIIILGKVKDGADVDPSPTTTSSPQDDVVCPAIGNVNNSTDWKEAADRLLAAIDPSVDPCEDFYQYTCGRYLAETDLGGESRKGTYDEAQYLINLGLANYFDSATLTSKTEKIQKKVYDACVADRQNDDESYNNQKAKQLLDDVNDVLGLPLFGFPSKAASASDLFTIMGQMERQFVGGPLLTSIVTADYKDANKNALYVSQPELSYARDYYVLPQFIASLQAYSKDIHDKLAGLASMFKPPLKLSPGFCITNEPDACLQEIADWTVNFERRLAMATWPETELRNYKQQYNPYDLDQLDAAFPSLNMSNYVNALVDGVRPTPFDEKIVLNQPTYFSALDALFASGEIAIDQYTNYLAIHFLLDHAEELGVELKIKKDSKDLFASRKNKDSTREKYTVRRGHGTRRLSYKGVNSRAITKNVDNQMRADCIDNLITYMPYGPGYTYVKSRGDRDAVRADIINQTELIIQSFSEQIDSLDWMTDETKARAHNKSLNLVRNYGWPSDLFGDFNDTTIIDAYHQDYEGILNAATYWDVLKGLKRGMETNEFFRLLGKPGDRSNFLQSPAMVNAWYQPERNSISFPFGILNPPYYNLKYPQAYNYAGQGGTGGHELTHGYDDEGVQFGPTGQLVACSFTHCGIMDDKSRSGFVDMAQCVVTQYNGKCCPLKSGNVRCVNGATTQGENIADLGGQLAAYRAYGKYTANQGLQKQLLPGLEMYTPNQIFWITYGVSWCMKLTDERLTKQLMVDPHAPSSCRVNQVMQDIPQFGRDFKCKRGTELFPKDQERCKVWIGF